MTCVGIQRAGPPDFENFPKCLDMVARNNWNDYLVRSLRSLFPDIFTCNRVHEFRNESFGRSISKPRSFDFDFQISMGLKTSGDSRTVKCCLPSRFLHYISNDATLTMKNNCSDLKQLAISYLSSFPTLTFAMVNLVKCTKWSNVRCFQEYFNGTN